MLRQPQTSENSDHHHSIKRRLVEQDEMERSCSRVGQFIQQREDWSALLSQRQMQKNGLGIAGVALILGGGLALYFGSWIIGLSCILLGGAAAGFIPWLTLPDKPLVMGYLPGKFSSHSTGPTAQRMSAAKVQDLSELNEERFAKEATFGNATELHGGLTFLAPNSDRSASSEVEAEKSELDSDDTFDIVKKMSPKARKKKKSR